MRRLGDRFVLVRELGSGGMSTVYLGRDEVLDRPVAVKVLRPDLDDRETGELFRREGRTAARLSHPNIVQVYDAGEDRMDGRGVSYIVMEYVPGGDLQAFLDRRGTLPEGMLSRVGSDVAAALAHAHERGVIHRDVKPRNVLLDERGNPKLADFGIARALDTTHEARGGSYLGTAAYSSPEQLRGDKVTPRADVYALGATLYHAAAGEPPFRGAPIEVANQQIQKKPAPPRERGASIGAGMQVLILGCLEKDPERRPDAARVHEKLSPRVRAGAAANIPALPGTAGTGRGRGAAGLAGASGVSRAFGAVRAAGASGLGAVRERWDRGPFGGASGGSPGPPEITISVPTRTFRSGSRQRTALALLFGAVLLLLLVVGGAWAVLSSGGDASSGSSNPGGRQQAAAPADRSEGKSEGRSGDQAGGQGDRGSGQQAANEAAPVGPDAAPAPPLGEARQAVFDLYVDESFGRVDATWSALSPRLQGEIGSPERWAEREDLYTFTYMEYLALPEATASGGTARVTFEARLDHTWGSEILSGTWVCVNENGSWRLDRLENEETTPA